MGSSAAKVRNFGHKWQVPEQNGLRLTLLRADQAVGVRMLFALLRSVIRATAGRVPRRACRETAACLYLGVRTQHIRRDATCTHDPAAPNERYERRSLL